jgi:hypothetical protein
MKRAAGLLLFAVLVSFFFLSEPTRSPSLNKLSPAKPRTMPASKPPAALNRKEPGTAPQQVAKAEVQAEWEIPFGKEFWRIGSGSAEMASNDSAKPLGPDSPEVQSAIDRVRHAFQDDSEGPVVVAETYRLSVHPEGFSFEPKGRAEAGPLSASFETELTSTSSKSPASLEWKVMGNTAQARLSDGVVEHVEARQSGTFLTWVFNERPADFGIQEFRIRVSGMSYAGQSANGHHFADESGVARVRFGNALAVDSAGFRWPVPVLRDSEGLKIAVPPGVLAQAVYPLAIDPEITPEEGVEIPFSTESPDPIQTMPAIASAKDGFLVAWEQCLFPLSYPEIRVTRITTNGIITNPGGVPVSVWNIKNHALNSRPSACSDGTNFFVAWRQEFENSNVIAGAIVKPNGEVALRKPLIISPGPSIATETPPSIAFDGVRYGLVWQSGKAYGGVVDAQNLNVVSGAITLSTNNIPGSPVIGWDGENFVAAWQDGGYQVAYRLRMRRFGPDGNVIDANPRVVASFTSSSEPFNKVDLSWSGAEYLLTWHQYGILLDRELRQVRAPFQTGAYRSPSTLWDGTNFWIAYTSGLRIAVNRISPAGDLLDGSGKEVVYARSTAAIDENSICLALGTDGKTVALGYGGVGYRFIAARLLQQPLPDPTQVEEGLVLSGRTERHPAIAPLGEGELIVWSAAGDGFDIYGARLDRTGALLDPNGFRIFGENSDETNPEIASLGDEALIICNSKRTYSYDIDILGVRINSKGYILGGKLLLAVASQDYIAPAVASSDDHYFVCWSYHTSGGSQLQGRSVSSEGVLGATISVTPGLPMSNGFSPVIASDGTDFLVAWNYPGTTITNSDGSLLHPTVYGARIDSTGILLDSQPIAVAPTGYVQLEPAVGFAGGNYLVSWLQETDPPPNNEVWAAPLFSTGQSGPAKLVAPANRQHSSISITGNGGAFLTSWRELNEDELGTSDIEGAYLRPDGTLSDEGVFIVNGGQFSWNPAVSMTPSAGMLIAAEGTRPETYRVVWNRTAGYEPPLVGVDDFTQGDWKGRYGGGGYLIAGDASSMPDFARVSFENAMRWTWAEDAAGEAALERADSSGRVAACWYSPESFDVRITFSDSAEHPVAFYFLDWDTQDREQLVEVFDAAGGTLLQSHYLTGFHGGKYLVYSLSGDIRIRLTREAGFNAVLSGIFFPGEDVPLQQVESPAINPNGGIFTGPVTASLSTATSGASIYYTLDGSEPNMNSTVYGGPMLIESTSTLKAIATKEGLANSAVSSANFTIESESGGSVRFVGEDPITQGNWTGKYGTEGYQVFGDREQLPDYATESIIGGSPWTWNDTTTDPAALQRVSQPDSRLAACVYSADAFEIRLNLPANESHRIALYCLDWDTADRNEEIKVISNGAVAQTLTVTDFHDGKYLLWEVSGDVTFRFEKVNGFNAVISGIFFDPISDTEEVVETPRIDPPAGAYNGAIQVSMSTGTEGASIYYTLDGSAPGTNSAVYTAPFELNQSAVVSARAFKPGFVPSSIAQNNYTLAPSEENAAVFIATDSSTEGSWRNTYGDSGFMVIQDWTDLPSYASVSVSGQSSHIWAYTVTNTPAVQKFSSEGRIASCWYAGESFEIEINLTDGQTHALSLYLLDWDMSSRSERIDILDGDSGILLETKTISGFENGKYERWNIKGHVRIRINRVTGPNAVVSGLFLD